MDRMNTKNEPLRLVVRLAAALLLTLVPACVDDPDSLEQTFGGICLPECQDRECGDDGCGGECGECETFCKGDGQCCQPDCNGRVCGDDGCGGSCGSCEAGVLCGAGQCLSTTNDPTGALYLEIPAGTFTMGSPDTEDCRDSDEKQHKVTLTQGFWMKETEVTQAEWEWAFGNNPSSFSGCGDNCPAETVNWYEAIAYANHLSDKAGLSLCYTLSSCDGQPGTDMECSSVSFVGLDCTGYRLPTEAEWEYAARAGSTTTFYNGDISSCTWTDANLGKIGWYDGNSDGKPHPVGKKTPNAWGLYDMSGNVLEWVWDWNGEHPSGSVTDPLGPNSGSYRVRRGGSWDYFARFCRSADRYYGDPGYRGSDLGFRLSRSLK